MEGTDDREKATAAMQPAGWYDYPGAKADVKRYWDGSKWTSQQTKVKSKAKGGFPRPHWRKMTWAIVIWSVLMGIWIVAGIASSDPASHCSHHAFLTKQSCEEARNAGTGIGVGILIFLWFLVFVPLSLIWFMTRPKGRECPVCGEKVKKGFTQCPSCNHDFAAAATPAPA
jgi:hypothetical protein